MKYYFLFIPVWLGFLVANMPLQAQNLFVDSSFGTNGVMKLASTDSLCITVPIFDIGNSIRAVHNTYDPSQAGLNFQGMIQFTSSGLKIDSSFANIGQFNYSLGNYNTNVINTNSAYALKTLKDGRVLIAGRKKTQNSPFIYQASVVCVKPNGGLDSSFNTNAISIYNHLGMDCRANDIHQNKENDLILVHAFSSNYDRNFILAYKLNGTLDSSFGTLGKAYWYGLHNPGEVVYNFKPLYDPHEAIWIYRAVYDSSNFMFKRNEWLKLKSYGVPDSSFGVNGIQVTDTMVIANSNGIIPSDFQTNCIDKHGNLYVINNMKLSTHQALMKYTSNGLLDSSFAVNGVYDLPSVPDTTYYSKQQFYCSSALNDGSLVVAGDIIDTTSPNKTDGLILRLTWNGIPDSSFFHHGYFYRDLNSYNQDGFREIHAPDSLQYYFCGTAHKSALNYAQFYLAFKMHLVPFPLETHPVLQAQPEIQVYPNPATETITIHSNKEINQLTLYSLNGICFLNETLRKNTEQLDVHPYPEGCYLLGIFSDGQWHYEQLVLRSHD